jgi:hypothetical protein
MRMTRRQIAKILNLDSVPSKRDSGRWHPTSVARILQADDLVGVADDLSTSPGDGVLQPPRRAR